MDENVYALSYYYPCNHYYKEHMEDDFSSSLLSFKKNKFDYSELFADYIYGFLVQSDLSTYFDIITIIPSSKIRESQPVERITEKLSEKLFTPYHKTFIKTGESQVYGKDRAAIYDNIKMIEESKEYLKNKRILVIDDIHTTGNSMKAVIKKLEENGAEKVIGIVLGKTYSENPIFKCSQLGFYQIKNLYKEPIEENL